MLYLQAALGVAQEALEREKGGMKALQEQLQSGKVSCCLFFGCHQLELWVLVRVGELEC